MKIYKVDESYIHGPFNEVLAQNEFYYVHKEDAERKQMELDYEAENNAGNDHVMHQMDVERYCALIEIEVIT